MLAGDLVIAQAQEPGLSKQTIVEALAAKGWRKDSLVDAFTKEFKTVVAPKCAHLWLKADREGPFWWLCNADFTSAGENVLAGLCAQLAYGTQTAVLQTKVARLVDEMEARIAGAYSVRLLQFKNSRT